MKKIAGVLLSCAAMLGVAAGASAQPQFEKAEDAIKYRQSALALMGAHSGGLAPIMRGRVPFDAEQVKAEVAILESLAGLPWKAFGEGTEGGNAKPEVWKDSAEFQQAAKTLQENVAKLADAADTGDFDKIRAAYADTGASCKACHDSFRQRR